MFKVSKFSGTMSEVSFHESRDLETTASRPRCTNLVRAFLVFGPINEVILQEALHRLVMRHEALRTKFLKNDGVFMRKVMTTADVMVERVDFSDVDAVDVAVATYISQIAVEGFAPEEYPLAKIRMLVTSGNRTVLVLTAAQVIVDAISAATLIRELGGLYMELSGGEPAYLPPLEYQLSDFVACQNIWMQSQEYKDRLMRLRDKLHCLLEASGGVQQLFFSSRQQDSFLCSKIFSTEFSEKIFRAAAVQKVSVPTVLMTLSAACVARARNREGVFFTSSFSNRHFAGAANLVGYLATTVPNFMDLSSGDAMALHVRNMHREIFASMSQYGMIPIQEIGKEIMRLYPQPPAGTSIKFGKLLIDVTPVEPFSMFGFRSERYPAGKALPVTNEFKFVYGVLPDDRIRLQLRGAAENDNELVARQIVEHALAESLESLSACA